AAGDGGDYSRLGRPKTCSGEASRASRIRLGSGSTSARTSDLALNRFGGDPWSDLHDADAPSCLHSQPDFANVVTGDFKALGARVPREEGQSRLLEQSVTVARVYIGKLDSHSGPQSVL